jgi:hypothetical protein
MGERGRSGLNRESWIDRQIREAEERGEFDDLPGKGKPLPDIDQPRDEMWWVKQLVRRENIKLTPPVLEVRRERDAALEAVQRAATEDEVRGIVAGVNRRIRDLNAKPTTGPPSNIAALDVDEVLARWRRDRR